MENRAAAPLYQLGDYSSWSEALQRKAGENFLFVSIQYRHRQPVSNAGNPSH